MAGYGDNDGLTAYAIAVGIALPAGDLTAARQRGSTAIDAAYESRFVGVPTEGIDQERSWPRTGATINGTALATSLIPQRVINASYEAALIELRKPYSLSVGGNPSARVKRQKVEGLEREFFDPGKSTSPWISSAIDGYLGPLLRVDYSETPLLLMSVGN